MMRKYRAFISYSHRDERVARRLHRRIESYRPPARLAVGASSPPRRVAPVFRDRDELATSVDLSARIREALEGSENLVVLCSPAAAASRWVNREIEEFAARRGSGAIHAVIVDGKTPEEAFPPALLALSAEPLAADLTEAGDGFEDGALKLVAGLLPAPYGEVKNREVARARARAWRNGLLAAAFGLIALVALAAGWRAMEETRAREAELTRAEAAILAAVQGIETIVDQVAAGAERGEIPVALAATLLATAEGMASGVVALAPENPRLSREYGDLLYQFALHHQRAGDLAKAADAAARAEEIFARLSASGDEYGSRWWAWALLQRGDAALAAGDRAGALESYEAGLAIARDLAARDPADAGWARDVSVSLTKLGDVRRAAGDRAGALEAYEEGLVIARGLAERDPGDAHRARDVSVSLTKVGDVRRAAGDRAGALEAYEEGLAIARDLAERDPGNAGLARGVPVSLERIGNVRLAAGDRAGALAAYEEGLSIFRGLAERDPGNAEWARDVSVSLIKLGDVRRSEGNRAGALAAYEEGLSIFRGLVERDPGNAGWARDVSVSLNRVGDVRLAGGDRAGALEAFQEGLAIARDLAERDSGNARWALDVVASLANMADADEARAADYWAEAVERVEDMSRRGILAPSDEWMLEDTKTQLAKARAR